MGSLQLVYEAWPIRVSYSVPAEVTIQHRSRCPALSLYIYKWLWDRPGKRSSCTPVEIASQDQQQRATGNCSRAMELANQSAIENNDGKVDGRPSLVNDSASNSEAVNRDETEETELVDENSHACCHS